MSDSYCPRCSCDKCIGNRNNAIINAIRKDMDYLKSLPPEEAKVYARAQLAKIGLYPEDSE